MKEEMKEALTARDWETAETIPQSQQELLNKIENLDRDRQEVKVSFENLYKERVGKLENQLRINIRSIEKCTSLCKV